MQHIWDSKKERQNKNPEVSVRVSVRPLRSNWKPVKLVEVEGSSKACSPAAQDQLDTKVWKTTKVRTELVEKKKLDLVSECSCHHGSPRRVPGLVLPCDCPKCECADGACTSVELSPERAKPESKDDFHVEKMKKEKKEERKKTKKARRHRSVSIVPPTPPNTVVSHDSLPKWNKLYEEKSHPVKPIDLKKMAAVPGQIGMSELEPEVEPENPRRSPTIHLAPPTTPNFFKPSPKTLIPPAVSSVSSLSLRSVHNQGLPPHRSPTNVQPPPFDNPPGIVSSMVSKVIGKKEEAPKVDVPEIVPITEPLPSTQAASSAVLLSSPRPAITPSVFRRLEQLFYGSESSWWIFVLFVMMTIFAYRSSIEQHTCYYD